MLRNLVVCCTALLAFGALAADAKKAESVAEKNKAVGTEVSIYKLKDGKIVDLFSMPNIMGIMAQIGPQAAAGGAPSLFSQGAIASPSIAQ